MLVARSRVHVRLESMRAESPNFKVTVKDLVAVPPPESVVVLVVALLDGNQNARPLFSR